MADHKVYRNPPIAMVAVEVRHSGTDPVTEEGYLAIKKRLRERWPVQLPGQDVTLDFGSPTPAPVVVEYQRFASRDRRSAIVVRPGMTTVETVDYKGWDDMRHAVQTALEVRTAVSEPSGYERVGLRYIDEVRIPGDDSIMDWSPWVHASLLAAQPDDGVALPLSDWQGVSQFGPVGGRSLVLRYGPRTGYAVEPKGNLRRPVAPTGAFFLLDIDSFWETTDDVPEFDPLELALRCDDLHAPVRQLFEGLITNKLREEVLDA